MSGNTKITLPTGVEIDCEKVTSGTADQIRGHQDLLRIAKLRGKPALCCCKRDAELRISICKREEHYYLARYPETGPAHHHACFFYAAEVPQSGAASYAPGVITEEDGIYTLRLDFGLAPKPPGTLPGTAPARVSSAPSNARPQASVLGLLHLLWEAARLNIFSPEKPLNTPTGWLSAALKLGRASTRIVVGRESLAKHLFVLPPKPGKMDLDRYAALAKLDKSRVVIVGRFYGLEPNGNVKGVHRLRIAGTAALAPKLYLNVPDTLAASTQGSFATQIARAQASGQVAFIAVGDFSLSSKTGTVPYARFNAVQLALMSITDHLIPIDSSFEQQMVDVLATAGRAFSKPLRYDADQAAVFPDFILTDTPAPCPIEVYGMQTPDYLKRRAEKIAYYQEHFPGSNWSWDTAKPMPPLPAKAASSAAANST